MQDIFFLRSVDRTSASASSSQFTIALNNTLVDKFEIEYLNMFNTFYSIQANYNDHIYWNDGGTNHSTTIPAGNYTNSGSTNIASAIGTAMTAATSASATVTAAFSTVTGLLTITSTQNFTLNFWTYATYSAAKTLGFANANTSAATTATASFVPSLSGPSSVNIRIQESDTNSWYNGLGAYGSILIPVNVSQGALKYYARTDFQQYIGFNRPVSALNITITDTSGVPISLNGSEWEMALRKVHARY